MRFLMPVCGLLLVSAALGQTPAKPRRSIGLALGGGGALGFTHVGVLAWFDEHHIPVDYLAGTSMGAIVGGFYASGKSPADMKTIVSSVDWNRMFRSNPEFKNLGFRRKEDRRAFPNPIEFGLRRGFSTRPGVTPGEELELFLDRVLLNYSAELDFDTLPTPFRCVATDLLSADPIVLKNGSLPVALRASTSIPGVFTPVERDGHVLIDGGIAENLPTAVVKAMGADLIVAISLPAGKIERQDLASLAGVLARSVSVAIIQNERRSIALADLVITPDIKDFGNFSYMAADQLIQLGYESAQRSSAKLLPLALTQPEWDAYQQNRRARQQSKPPAPMFVAVEGGKPEARARVEEIFSPNLGKPLDPDVIEDQLSMVEGSGRYDSASYRVENRNGESGLVVQLQPKPYGPPFVYAALDINGEEPRNVTFSFLTRIVLLDLGGFDSELRNTIGVGQRTILATEYYHRLGATGWFIAPFAGYQRDLSEVFTNQVGRAEYVVERVGTGLDGGFTFSRKAEIRTGFEIGHLRTRLRIGSPVEPLVDDGFKSINVRATYDGQDSPLVPRSGLRLLLNGHYFLDSPADGRFVQAQLEGSYFYSLSEKHELFTTFGGGSSFGERLPLPLQFTLGRPLALGELRVDELRGDRYFYGTAGYLRPLARFPRLLGERLLVGGWYTVGGLPSSLYAQTFYQSGTVGIVAETSLGPFYLGASFGDSGRKQVAFRLGKFF